MNPQLVTCISHREQHLVPRCSPAGVVGAMPASSGNVVSRLTADLFILKTRHLPLWSCRCFTSLHEPFHVRKQVGNLQPVLENFEAGEAASGRCLELHPGLGQRHLLRRQQIYRLETGNLVPPGWKDLCALFMACLANGHQLTLAELASLCEVACLLLTGGLNTRAGRAGMRSNVQIQPSLHPGSCCLLPRWDKQPLMLEYTAKGSSSPSRAEMSFLAA